MEQIASNFIELYGLAAIFILMFINGLASAFPSEIVYGLSGTLISFDKLTIVGVLLAGISGNVAGTTLLYIIGRKIGYQWFLDLKQNLLKYNWLTKLISNWMPGENFFLYLINLLKKKNGYFFIGYSRCLTPIRCVVSLPAGMLKMSFGIFVLYTTIGCTIWASFWLGLGYLVGESWHNWSQVATIGFIIILVLIIFYLKHKITKDLKKGIIK